VAVGRNPVVATATGSSVTLSALVQVFLQVYLVYSGSGKIFRYRSGSGFVVSTGSEKKIRGIAPPYFL